MVNARNHVLWVTTYLETISLLPVKHVLLTVWSANLLPTVLAALNHTH